MTCAIKDRLYLKTVVHGYKLPIHLFLISEYEIDT